MSRGPERVRQLAVRPELPLQEAMAVLDRGGCGAVLVCGDEFRLEGILTDGDIRRAILAHTPMDAPCSSIAVHMPVTGPAGMAAGEALHLMDHGKPYLVNHLPLLDDAGRVVDVLLRSDLVGESAPPLSAVIMAGGYGKRLHPLTENMPKPMLPVGDRPLLQHLVEQLKGAGIHRLNITTHFMPEKIVDHFGDGSRFGVDIEYVDEDQPLGTAGALRLMQQPEEPFLVINGDILTDVNFNALLAFHREQHAELTVAVRKYDVQVPYGVLECDGPRVLSLLEKPIHSVLVSAGIYLMEPSVYRHLGSEGRRDMTEVIEAVIGDGGVVASFPLIEYWLDIGRPEDYSKAQADAVDRKHGRPPDDAEPRSEE